MSYVPTPAQAPTPQASGSRSGMKILTIIGACLAILFLFVASVILVRVVAVSVSVSLA